MTTEKDNTKLYEEKSDFNKSGDNKPKERKIRKEKTKPLTKVIIRRLPPSMTEDDLRQQIEPIPEYDYFYFVAADYSLGENATSRAYINFIQQEDIFLFKDKFDGYVFVDTKGADYPAVVEFAPFQGLPKMKSRKNDNKCGTIESDQHYISFLASLTAVENDTSKPDAKMEYCYQIKDDKKITSTPLLEFIASKKQARREERRKKIEEKKKQREDEKIRKQNQVVMGIPASIQEEDDDGIIVRTIKSRPLDRDRGKKDRIFEAKSKLASDNKGRNYKEERDRKRFGRDERRRAEREKQSIVRQKNVDEQNLKRKDDQEKSRRDRGGNGAGEGTSSKDESAVKNKDNNNKRGSKENNGKSSLKEDKVKKYSESRKERFNKSEMTKESANNKSIKTDDNESKEVVTSRKEEMKLKREESGSADLERQSSVDDGKHDSSSGDGDNSNAMKEERKRIKNKDRPSLQIYQPGKRRLATNVPSSATAATNDKKDDGKNSDEKLKSIASSSVEKIPIEKDFPKDEPTLESSTIKSDKNLLKNEQDLLQINTKKQGTSSNDKKSTTFNDKPAEQRKVTRYSERRNKARERRGSIKMEIEMSTEQVDGISNDLKKVQLSENWNKICSDDNNLE